ncbi:hypothetical protein [Rhodosalinus sp.]|uniref:hypothetical protein n=1 Tax=Rhodosalinus sp. TaxID=2047741 RepID=UPI00356136B2
MKPEPLEITAGRGLARFRLDCFVPILQSKIRHGPPFRLLSQSSAWIDDDGIFNVPRDPMRDETLEFELNAGAGHFWTEQLRVVVAERALMVPMGLHALVLDAPTVVAGPLAEFTRLPHTTPSGADVAPDTPYIGDEVESQPFRNLTMTLSPGVHLHWTLPGAHRRGGSHRVLFDYDLDEEERGSIDRMVLPGGLRARFAKEGHALHADACLEHGNTPGRWRVRQQGDAAAYRLRLAERYEPASDGHGVSARTTLHVYDPGARFPLVPNRWLVTRRRDDQPERRWLVESDVIRDKDEPGAAHTISFPNDPETQHEPPFTRLGRVRALHEWLARDDEAESHDRHVALTALGYGEPSFAAFYPSCHSVFGFHDAETADMSGAERGALSYDVVGWHDDPADDLLNGPDLADQIEDRARRVGLSRRDGAAATVHWHRLGYEALGEALGWTVDPDESDGPLPERTLAYARLRLSDTDGESTSAPDRQRSVTVAFGNTASEAVSAFFAGAMEDDADAILTVEEQLESLHLSGHLDGKANDLLFHFRAARHRNAFQSVASGSRWMVTMPDADQSEGYLEPAAEDMVPREATAPLDRLNRAQAALNRAIEARDSKQSELFADWQKYLDRTVAFDPPEAGMGNIAADTIRRFIERHSLPAVEAARAHIKACEATRDHAFASLSATLREAEAKGKARLAIAATPEERYWRPHDPVMVISGVDLGSAPHETPHARVACFPVALVDAPPNVPDALDAAVDAIEADDGPGIHRADPALWRPFLFEWQAESRRLEEAGHTREEAHGSDFLEANFVNDPDGMDLVPRDNAPGVLSRRAHRIAGRSLLSADTEQLLGDKLDAVLGRRLAELKRRTDHSADAPAQASEEMNPAEPDGLGALIAWFEQSAPASARSDPLATRLRDLRARLDHHASERLLSVKLGGFHDTLLMRRSTMQLPVGIPLGFDSERRLAARVRETVGRQGVSAPAPAGMFNPLRAGRLTLSALRLVDCFGRVRDLSFSGGSVRGPTGIIDPDPDAPGALRLRPRLAQPARLEVRWLAAASATGMADEAETSKAPASSPVAGFVLHNHLDCTLAVYDARGRPMGVADIDGHWRPPPGRDGVALSEIVDPALRRVVQYFLAHSSEAMHARIESHLRASRPGGHADDAAPAFLAGRPLVVARARLALEVKGELATHQGWRAFERTLAAAAEASDTTAPRRETDGVASVTVSVRLGDFGLRDDGLVAFWEETATEDGRTRLGPGRFDEAERHLSLTPDGGPRTATMLFDPYGTIHAASGLLPVSRLTLASEHYAAGLNRIETGFAVGPILSRFAEPRIPLPRVPGHSWLWASTEAGDRKVVTTPRSPAGAKDWGGRQRLCEGWLLLNNEGEEDER